MSPEQRNRQFAPYDPHAERQSAPDGLSLRFAAPKDITAIAQLSAERDGNDLQPHLNVVTRHLALPATRMRLWVVTAAARILGFARCAIHDHPYQNAPCGWYLAGVVIAAQHRRRGLAHQLTEARLRWLQARTQHVYYYANARNQASIDLHAALGFVEFTRHFSIPGVHFDGGVGVLFRKTFTDGV